MKSIDIMSVTCQESRFLQSFSFCPLLNGSNKLFSFSGHIKVSTSWEVLPNIAVWPNGSKTLHRVFASLFQACFWTYPFLELLAYQYQDACCGDSFEHPPGAHVGIPWWVSPHCLQLLYVSSAVSLSISRRTLWEFLWRPTNCIHLLSGFSMWSISTVVLNDIWQSFLYPFSVFETSNINILICAWSVKN